MRGPGGESTPKPKVEVNRRGDPRDRDGLINSQNTFVADPDPIRGVP